MTAANVEVIAWDYPHQIGTHNALAMAAGIAVGHGMPVDPTLALIAEPSGLLRILLTWEDDSEIVLRVDTSTWQGALRLLLAS
jgi:hypothetical protein